MKEGIFDFYEEFSACLDLIEEFPASKVTLEAKHFDLIDGLLEECNEYLLTKYSKTGLKASLRSFMEKRVATLQCLVRTARFE